jgi:hypothetical protein
MSKYHIQKIFVSQPSVFAGIPRFSAKSAWNLQFKMVELKKGVL